MDSIPEAEPGSAAKQRDEVEHYHSRLVLIASESMDLDLLNPNRSVIHSGKLLRKSESVFEWSSGWSELFVLLFDNYQNWMVSQKHAKYQVNERPVPLDLLTLVSFTEAPTRRDTRFLRGLRGASGNSNLFPLTLHYNGRTGGPFNLYAQSSEDRSEWKEKLEEALFLRRIVQDSNKAFDAQMLNDDRTFLLPSLPVNGKSLEPDIQDQYTGKVTCSVPFSKDDLYLSCRIFALTSIQRRRTAVL
ncbi:hypothetical protein H0H93_013259 [Arthromyces matolae]|nr:hypothetical protein H0H93_013259 [Arthromyces matolae]